MMVIIMLLENTTWRLKNTAINIHHIPSKQRLKSFITPNYKNKLGLCCRKLRIVLLGLSKKFKEGKMLVI